MARQSPPVAGLQPSRFEYRMARHVPCPGVVVVPSSLSSSTRRPGVPVPRFCRCCGRRVRQSPRSPALAFAAFLNTP